MREKNNLVAHYQGGGSDKVYIASVRRESDGTWTVVCKYGRRGKTMQITEKTRGASESKARIVQRNVFNEKLQKGYIDIESAGYSGPVSLTDPTVMDNLETEGPSPESKLGTTKAMEEREKSKKGKPLTQAFSEEEMKDMAALCVDTAGMEDSFDKGIEYVFEQHKDSSMLYVYDKFGKKRECFKERFRLVKAS